MVLLDVLKGQERQENLHFLHYFANPFQQVKAISSQPKIQTENEDKNNIVECLKSIILSALLAQFFLENLARFFQIEFLNPCNFAGRFKGPKLFRLKIFVHKSIIFAKDVGIHLLHSLLQGTIKIRLTTRDIKLTTAISVKENLQKIT